MLLNHDRRTARRSTQVLGLYGRNRSADFSFEYWRWGAIGSPVRDVGSGVRISRYDLERVVSAYRSDRVATGRRDNAN